MSPRGSLATKFSQFLRLYRSTRASTAMVVALAFVPIAVGAGTGLDLARAMVVRTRLAEALDAASLAVGAAKGLTLAQMQTLAQNYFSANYNVSGSFGTPGPVSIAIDTNTVTVSDNVPVPTVLMKLVGLDTMNVAYTSQVTWGQTKLWVSLVLDNTGSMSQKDANGVSKISALKTATTQLLSTLQGIAQNPGDVMISIVPFTTGVNVGTANNSASWLSFVPWDAVGSGDGSYKNALGLPCQPGPGCSWVANDPTHSQWSGCVMDRDQNNDVENTAPNPSDVTTLFPAAPPALYAHTPANSWKLACPEQLVPLTDVSAQSGYTALTNEINGMTAGGTTDQPIGFAMGWMTLTNSAPFSPGAIPSDTTPIVIIVSDGLNTQDRWTGDGTSEDTAADQREALVCSNMKAAGITIYTVYVDLNGTQGNSAPLQDCASSPGDYFDLTTSGQIVTAFQQIGTQITQLHLSK
jgi:Flp pilus assembly protein TadG